MGDYPPRVEKSENIYRLWETGEGDMGELAIGLYDLTAHYKELWDDYAQLEVENERLKEYIEETCDEDFVMWCREQDALKEDDDVQPTS